MGEAAAVEGGDELEFESGVVAQPVLPGAQLTAQRAAYLAARADQHEVDPRARSWPVKRNRPARGGVRRDAGGGGIGLGMAHVCNPADEGERDGVRMGIRCWRAWSWSKDTFIAIQRYNGFGPLSSAVAGEVP